MPQADEYGKKIFNTPAQTRPAGVTPTTPEREKLYGDKKRAAVSEKKAEAATPVVPKPMATRTTFKDWFSETERLQEYFSDTSYKTPEEIEAVTVELDNLYSFIAHARNFNEVLKKDLPKEYATAIDDMVNGYTNYLKTMQSQIGGYAEYYGKFKNKQDFDDWQYRQSKTAEEIEADYNRMKAEYVQYARDNSGSTDILGTVEGTGVKYKPEMEKRVKQLEYYEVQLRRKKAEDEHAKQEAVSAEDKAFRDSMTYTEMANDLEGKKKSLFYNENSSLKDNHTEKEIRELKEEIAYLEKNLPVKKVEEYRADPDFDKYVSEGKSVVKSVNSFGVNHPTFGENNNPAEYAIKNKLISTGGYDPKDELYKKQNLVMPIYLYYYLTDDERTTYDYLFAKQGFKNAEAYATTLKSELINRINNNYAYELGKEFPVIGVFDEALARTAQPFEGLYNLGSFVDGYERSYKISDSVNQLNAGVTSKMGSTGKFFYNLGQSSVQSLVAAAIPGGEALLGLAAADDAMNTVEKNGGSDLQILATGLAFGAAETVFEHFSLELLRKPVALKDIKSVLKNIPLSAGTNASEEFVTNFSNQVSDYLINGGLSDYAQRVDYYINSEYLPEREARKRALNDMAKDDVMSALGGAIQGMFFAGIQPFTRQSRSYNQNYTAAINASFTTDNAELKDFANRLQTGQEKWNASNFTKLIDGIQAQRDAEVLGKLNANEGMALQDPSVRSFIASDANAEKLYDWSFQKYGAENALEAASILKQKAAEKDANLATDLKLIQDSVDKAVSNIKANVAFTKGQKDAILSAVEKSGYKVMHDPEINDVVISQEYNAIYVNTATPKGINALAAALGVSSKASIATPQTGTRGNLGSYFAKYKSIKKSGLYGLMGGTKGLTGEQAKEIHQIAKDLKMRVKIDKNVPLWLNGMVDSLGNTVISYGSEDPYSVVFFHEAIHRVSDSAPDEYLKFRDAVVKYHVKNGGYGSVADMIAAYSKDLKAAGLPVMDTVNIMDELAADFPGAHLFKDNNLLNVFVKEHKSLARRFIDAIKSIIAKVRGNTDYLKNAQAALQKAYARATQNADSTSGKENAVRYSISKEQDKKYLNAVESGDMETAQQMVNEAAERSGLYIFEGEERNNTVFSVRTKPNPKSKKIVYKLFDVVDGKPQALYIDKATPKKSGDGLSVKSSTGTSIPVGVWLDAKEGQWHYGKNGRKYVYSKLGDLSYRPGWHASSLPLTGHIGDDISDVPYGKVKRPNQVYYICEINTDYNYEAEVEEIRLRERDESLGLDRLPADGYYEYKTNTNASDDVNWYISGSLKIVRPMSESEVNSILKDKNLTPQLWETKEGAKLKSKDKTKENATGPLVLSDYGINTTEEVPNSGKILDAVTYDDNGKIIPLSERFNANKYDIRYSIKKATKTSIDTDVKNARSELQTAQEGIKSAEELRDSAIDRVGNLLYEIGESADTTLELQKAFSNMETAVRYLEQSKNKNETVRARYAEMYKESNNKWIDELYKAKEKAENKKVKDSMRESIDELVSYSMNLEKKLEKAIDKQLSIKEEYKEKLRVLKLKEDYTFSLLEKETAERKELERDKNTRERRDVVAMLRDLAEGKLPGMTPFTAKIFREGLPKALFLNPNESKGTVDGALYTGSISPDDIGKIHDILKETRKMAGKGTGDIKPDIYRDAAKKISDILETYVVKRVEGETDKSIEKTANAIEQHRTKIVPVNEKRNKAAGVLQAKVNTQQRLTDAGQPVDKIGKITNDPVLYSLYNSARASRSVSGYIMEDGFYSPSGKKLGDSGRSWRSIVDTITKKGEEYKPEDIAFFVSEDGKVFDDPSAAKGKDKYWYAFDYYLNHMHNGKGGRYAEGKPVFGMGVTDKISEQAAAFYLAKYPEFAKFGKSIYNFLDGLNQYMIELGRLKQSMVNDWKAQSPYYVPTHREVYNDSINSMERATGGVSDLLDLRVQIPRMIRGYVQMAQTNAFSQRLLKDILDNQEATATYAVVEETENIENFEDFLKDLETQENGEDTDLYRVGVEFENEVSKRKAVKVFVNGKQMRLRLSPAMELAYNEINHKYADIALLKPLSGMRSVIQKTATELSPTFLLRNPIKDVQGALVFSETLGGYMKNYPAAWKDIIGGNELWRIYCSNGAVSNSLYNFNVGLEKKSVLHRLGKVNFVVEQVTRYAEFRNSLYEQQKKAGLLIGGKINQNALNYNMLSTAYLAASDVTVNFNRAGSWMREANRYLAFSNAVVQGTSKLYRSLTQSRQGKTWYTTLAKSMLNTVWKAAFLGIGIPELLKYIYKDDEEYEDILKDLKGEYFVFKIGGTWIKIPMGHANGFLSVATQTFMDYATGKKQGFGNFVTDTGRVMSELFPDYTGNALVVAFETFVSNRNFYGGDIVPDFMKGLPEYQQYDSDTSYIFRGIGKWLYHSAGFENKIASPMMLQYLFDQTFGFAADWLIAWTNYTSNDDYVVNKAFSANPTIYNQFISEYYDIRDKYAKDSKSTLLSKEKLQEATEKYWFMNSASEQFTAYRNYIAEMEKEWLTPFTGDSLDRSHSVDMIKDLRNATAKQYVQAVENFYKAEKRYLSEYGYNPDGEEKEQKDILTRARLAAYTETLSGAEALDGVPGYTKYLAAANRVTEKYQQSLFTGSDGDDDSLYEALSMVLSSGEYDAWLELVKKKGQHATDKDKVRRIMMILSELGYYEVGTDMGKITKVGAQIVAQIMLNGTSESKERIGAYKQYFAQHKEYIREDYPLLKPILEDADDFTDLYKD